MCWPWNECCFILTGFLSSLPIRLPHLQMKPWMDQNNSDTRAATLIKKLDSLVLTFEELSKLYQKSAPGEHFLTALKLKGINSKPLWEKLVKALGYSRSRSTPLPVSTLSPVFTLLLAPPPYNLCCCFLHWLFSDPQHMQKIPPT